MNKNMEKMQYIVVAGLIRNKNKYLVVYKHTSTSDKCRNRWELPGGKVRFGLGFVDALKEKLNDYLGVDVVVHRLMPKVFSNVSEELTVSKHFYVLVGECKLLSDGVKLNRKKLSEHKWITLKEAELLFRDDLLVEGDLEFMRMATKSDS